MGFCTPCSSMHDDSDSDRSSQLTGWVRGRENTRTDPALVLKRGVDKFLLNKVLCGEGKIDHHGIDPREKEASYILGVPPRCCVRLSCIFLQATAFC